MFIKKRFALATLLGVVGISTLTSAYAFNTKGGKIYDSVGNEVLLDGIAWIGFQDSNFLGGLWNVPFNPIGTQHGVVELLKSPWTVPGSNITSADNGTAFRTIRLAIQPGIWGTVNSTQSSPFDFSKTDVNNQSAGNGPFCDWTNNQSDASGHCIKTKSASDLLTATINEFNKQNILVMLDIHHRPGLGDGFRDGTVVASDYTLQNYHDNLAKFAQSAQTNVLGIDIYNEPHNLYWYKDNTQTTPVQPAWIKVIAAAASAVYDNNQNLLLIVEGPGGTIGNDPYDPVYSLSTPICLPATTKVDDTSVIGLANDPNSCHYSLAKKHDVKGVNTQRVTNIGVNWGENFRALLDPTQTVNGVASFDVKTFRSMLVQAITTNNFSSTDPNLIADWLLGPNNDGNNGHIVFAPHLYGKQVGGWQSDANDSQIRFKWNFGFLFDSGFPITVGELGYDVQEPASGGEDFFLNSVAPYLVNKKINHNLFFWTFNNADYPVGLRGSDSDYTLFTWKEQDLHNLFNAIVPVQTFGTLCVTVPTPSGYTGTAYPSITASGTSNYVFNLTQFDSSTCLNNVATGSYNLSGSSILSGDGSYYMPAQTYSTSVAQNTQSDVSVQYVQQPMGSLQVSVSGDSNCAIASNQQFTVSYTQGSFSKQLTVTNQAPVTVKAPVGTYAIKVSPDPLPSNTQCAANYTNSVTIDANTTTTDAINYIYTPVSACSVKTACSTWGTPQDPWSGSSCNFYINVKGGMTVPTSFTVPTTGITSLTGFWGVNSATLANGSVMMDLQDPVNNTNIGFNANGVITFDPKGVNATIVTNGQTLTCPLVFG